MSETIIQTSLSFKEIHSKIIDLSKEEIDLKILSTDEKETLYLSHAFKKAPITKLPYLSNLPTFHMRVELKSNGLIISNDTRAMSSIMAIMFISLLWSLIIGYSVVYPDIKALWFCLIGVIVSVLFLGFLKVELNMEKRITEHLKRILK